MMHRRIFGFALVVTICLMGVAQAAFQLTWDGGNGMWYSEFNDSPTGKWNGGQNVNTVIGRQSGQEGYNGATGATDILIGSGKVSYDAFLIDEGFRVLQGSNMTITGGAVWEQETLAEDVLGDPDLGDRFQWAEKGWTTMDLSNLNLDNGTYRRTGSVSAAVGEPGGGPLIFGSWKGDDNFGDFDGDDDTDGGDWLDRQINAPQNGSHYRRVQGTLGQNPQTETVNINITNGGSLENEGQLWFGSEDSEFPTNVNVNINDGSITAIGGILSADATDDFGGDFATDPDASIIFFKLEDNVQVKIDFTGPGSINTDEGAIRMLDFDTGIVTDLTYQDLWDTGVLTANGSNAGTFGDFFSVTGNWGDASYVLTSLIPAATASIRAVPEPTSVVLAGLAMLALAFTAHGRRRANGAC